MNKDVNKRDQILFEENFDESKYSGGIRYFENLILNKLELLLKEDFIDKDESQNSSPTTKEFLEIIKKEPGLTCHGYAVSIERDDYRVSIEGIEGQLNDIKLIEELNDADEFTIMNKDPLTIYCWWD